MNRAPRYRLESLFLATVVLVSIAGFWTLYFGPDAAPNSHHHLHVITNFIWLALLAAQLYLVANDRRQQHRTVGLAVLVVAPLLFATTALLSVHSAHKGIVSGRGDFLIIQNVGVTLELGLLMLLALLLRKRRKLHGAFLLGTAMLFLGIALFFAMIAFVPAFEIQGPETFHRFGQAAATGSAICLAIGALFVIKDRRNNWPMLLAAAFFSLNEAIKAVLTKNGLIDPLTQFVGSLSQPMTFAVSFVLLFALLGATGVWSRRLPAPIPSGAT
jgi:hypothetical protein